MSLQWREHVSRYSTPLRGGGGASLTVVVNRPTTAGPLHHVFTHESVILTRVLCVVAVGMGGLFPFLFLQTIVWDLYNSLEDVRDPSSLQIAIMSFINALISFKAGEVGVLTLHTALAQCSPHTHTSPVTVPTHCHSTLVTLCQCRPLVSHTSTV